MKHDEITRLLKEIQANQQSLHDDMASLSPADGAKQRKVTQG